MKKYKVIKKRPGGPEVGTIVENNSEYGYFRDYDCLEYKEYFEEIKESVVPASVEDCKDIRFCWGVLDAFNELWILRDETRRRDNNWKPNYTTSNYKYTIEYALDCVNKSKTTGTSRFLVFSTDKIRDEFLIKHIELINRAKDLL